MSTGDDHGTTLVGVTRRACWPAAPGVYTEDDVCVDPALGLAAVARGVGAIGGQGKPAGKLAVWSVAGELARAAPDEARDVVLRRGLARADQAIARLTAAWSPGLLRPHAMIAAVVLDGAQLIVAHVGRCRVSRLGPAGVEPLTVDHTVAATGEVDGAHPAARVVTRTLGRGGTPDLRRIDVRAGDVLALTAPPLEERVAPAALADALGRIAAAGVAIAPVADALVAQAASASPRSGAATLALVRIERGGAVAPASRASSAPPRPPWLYRPGAALASPPPAWCAGAAAGGPDAAWFAEVFDEVMAGD